MTFIKARTDRIGSPQFFLKAVIERDDIVVPGFNPTHPRPDLKSYIPEERYDPVDVTKLDVMMMDSLDPHEEVQKYHRKKIEGVSIAERK